MPTNSLQEELKQFEKDLGHLVARFLRLYEALEREARPVPPPPPARAPPSPNALVSPMYQ